MGFLSPSLLLLFFLAAFSALQISSRVLGIQLGLNGSLFNFGKDIKVKLTFDVIYFLKVISHCSSNFNWGRDRRAPFTICGFDSLF